MNKRKDIAIILALFFGLFGFHKFYLKEYKKGWFYFLLFWTYIPLIISFYDIYFLFCLHDDDFNSKYNPKNTTFNKHNLRSNDF